MRGAPKKVTPAEALERLQSLCARAEHCSWELRVKMRHWGIASDDADRIIASLEKQSFLDDERFARSFVRDRYRRARWGRLKIRAALYAKHVPAWLADEALTEIEDDEYQAGLDSVLAAKARALGDEAMTFEGRTKLFRHAASRGYELSLIASRIKDPALWKSLRLKE